MVPIRYRFNAGIDNPEEYEVRKAWLRHATPSIGGGCVVGESMEARVLYCPGCRDADREWSKKSHVKSAGDGDAVEGAAVM